MGWMPSMSSTSRTASRTIATVREVAPHLDAQLETDRIEQMEINDTDGLRVLPERRSFWRSCRRSATPS